MLGNKLEHLLLEHINLLVSSPKASIHVLDDLLGGLLNAIVRVVSLFNRLHHVQVAPILQLLGQIDHPQEVAVDRGALLELVAVFSFGHSLECLSHYRDQHVEN